MQTLGGHARTAWSPGVNRRRPRRPAPRRNQLPWPQRSRLHSCHQHCNVVQNNTERNTSVTIQPFLPTIEEGKGGRLAEQLLPCFRIHVKPLVPRLAIQTDNIAVIMGFFVAISILAQQNSFETCKAVYFAYFESIFNYGYVLTMAWIIHE